MDLVDKQDDVPALVNLLEHLLQALLKVTTVTRTRNKRTQVQGVKLLILQRLWNLAVNNVQGQALDNSGFTHTGFTDKNRIVLGAAGKNLHDALDFLLTPHHRIKLAVAGSLGQVPAELV